MNPDRKSLWVLVRRRSPVTVAGKRSVKSSEIGISQRWGEEQVEDEEMTIDIIDDSFKKLG